MSVASKNKRSNHNNKADPLTAAAAELVLSGSGCESHHESEHNFSGAQDVVGTSATNDAVVAP